MSSGRIVNLLDSASAESNDKPSSWPHYAMGAKARPESDRKGHCFPESAEESFTKVLPIGWKKEDRRRAVKEEILMEQNVAVAMRDGVKLLVDVFRSPKSSKGGDEQVPTIVMYGPYGKSGTGPLQVRPKISRSKFELDSHYM
jgi:predicted acyl esterase